MGQVELLGIQGANLRDRFQPSFDISLRRNEWRRWRSAAQAHAGNVAAENEVVPMIDMVMARVTGRGDRANLKRRDADNIVVRQDADAFRRDPRKFSPEPFHVVAIKAGGGCDQFRRVDEMRRAARVDGDGRAELGETPRRAGVIEMNMAEENMPDVAGSESKFAEFALDVLEGDRK